jgi:hypothetical protein
MHVTSRVHPARKGAHTTRTRERNVRDGARDRTVTTEQEADMDRWTSMALRRAFDERNQHLWTAPPRNQDWIAARIGRG